MPLQKFLFNPGINKEGTDYTAEGGWFDGNLVRFRKGFAEKIGGWTKVIQTSYNGTGRKLLGWVDLAGTKLLGLGTRTKLYIQEGTNYNDITPIRSTTAAGDVTFAATNGSSTLTVTDTAHGASQGDFVTFSGAAAVGGILAAQLNQNFEITVIDANTFTIQTTGTATSATTGGGTAITAAFEIDIGADSSIGGYGWGTSTWSRGTWGSGSTVPAIVNVRLVFMDNFNNDLVFNLNNQGAIYYWTYSAGFGNRAVLLSSLAGAIAVPAGTEKTLFAPSGHLLALGATSYSETSTAGASISSITSSGTTATLTTGSAHGLATNDWVYLSGQTPVMYSGTYQVTVTGTTTFTYTLAASTSSPAEQQDLIKFFLIRVVHLTLC